VYVPIRDSESSASILRTAAAGVLFVSRPVPAVDSGAAVAIGHGPSWPAVAVTAVLFVFGVPAPTTVAAGVLFVFGLPAPTTVTAAGCAQVVPRQAQDPRHANK
jgi:hypothetical protein